MKLGLCVGGNTIAANSIIQSPGGRSQSGCVGVRVDEPDPPRHAQGISAQLAMWTRPAPGDVTFTSRWRQRSERDEPRTYSADASVDHTEERNDFVGCFGRSDRSAQGDRSTLRSITPKLAMSPAL